MKRNITKVREEMKKRGFDIVST